MALRDVRMPFHKAQIMIGPRKKSPQLNRLDECIRVGKTEPTQLTNIRRIDGEPKDFQKVARS